MKTTQKKMSMLAIATAIAVGAIAPAMATMNAEQAQAKTETVRAKSDHILYKKDGTFEKTLIFTPKMMKKGQWYTVDLSTPVIKAKNGKKLTPVRYMGNTVYLNSMDVLKDFVDKG